MKLSIKRLFASLALIGALVTPNTAFATFGGTVTLCDHRDNETVEMSQFEYSIWALLGGWILLLLGVVTEGPCEEQPQAQTTGDLTINKYIDQNANQTQDGGEGAHEGVTFTITGPNAYSETGQTDAAGQISLTDLEPGDYTVTETVPDGWRSTTGSSQNISIAASDDAEVTFGNQELGELRITKYEDLNGNDQEDGGEPRTPGVKFSISGPEGYSNNVQTNSNGRKNLDELVPGDYTIAEEVPDGYAPTGPNPRVVTVGTDRADVSFGNIGFGWLQITKFEDLDGDGVEEPGDGETRMPGVHFIVTGPNGYSKNVQTNSNGRKNLDELVPGEYTITEQVPDGYTVVGDVSRTVTVDAAPGGGVPSIEVIFANEPEEVEVEATPTPEPVGRIRLLKYEDTNGNGSRDSGEPVMPGVGFSVSGPTGDSTFVTNPSGLKHMIGIPFGTYTFTETVPDGYVLTSHPNPFSVVVDKTTITYIFVGNQPVQPEVEQTPEPTSTPEVEVTPEVEGSPDPTDDPGVNDQGTQGSSSQSDPSNPGTSASALAPVSFADTGLNSLAGLGTTLISIGAYAAVRRRLRRS